MQQSIQAQTISNLYLAENDLEIIPVLNKVDLQVILKSK
jgi:translation elongation factor EF-4